MEEHTHLAPKLRRQADLDDLTAAVLRIAECLERLERRLTKNPGDIHA